MIPSKKEQVDKELWKEESKIQKNSLLKYSMGNKGEREEEKEEIKEGFEDFYIIEDSK